MPMDFPDMESLRDAAKVWNFPQPHKGISEDEYRSRLATHVARTDEVEAHEIRTGLGWNWWTIPGVAPKFCAQARQRLTPIGEAHLKKLREERNATRSGSRGDIS